jgi:hypothetical protein
MIDLTVKQVIEMLDRTTKYTAKEFKAFPRYANGDLKDLRYIWLWLKPAQIKQLTDDDTSRCWEYEEENATILAECIAEFS